MSITRETVEQAARLARLTVADDDKDRLAGELSAILGFVEQLDEIKIEPGTSQASGVPSRTQAIDRPSRSLPRDIEDLANRDPETVCAWCNQPCRDPVQDGECDGPPVEYCE